MIGTNENGFYMPVAPAGYGNNGGFGNGDWGEWIILFLIFGMFGFGNNGFGGNNQLGYDFPWLMNGQNNINSNTNDGFRDAAISTGINGIQSAVTSGFGDMQTALCGGFAGVNATVNGAQNAITQQLYTNQIAEMNQRFTDTLALNNQMTGLAAGLQNCCCENRSGLADIKYTVATENCADRQALSNGIRDLLTAQTANTQRILDQMCQDKIDAKNDTIDQLRSELLYARGQASQVAQTAAIEQYVRPVPNPAFVVANPYYPATSTT